MQITITGKANRHNRKEVAAAMGGLGQLFEKFDELKTEAEVNEQIAGISGYCSALVVMGVLDEKTLNTEVREAVARKASRRIMELLHPDLLKDDEGAQEDGN